MRKLLIYPLIFASLSTGLILGGCTTNVPMPNLIHRPDIQQGNVITQEMVNRLQPGMDRKQVRYLLGSPMLVDVFHQDRWDYLYTNKPGSSSDTEQRHVILYFVDNRLARLEGDYRPMAVTDSNLIREESAIPVPASKREKGFLMRMWDRIKSTDEDQAAVPTQAERKEQAIRTAPPIPEPKEEASPPPQLP